MSDASLFKDKHIPRAPRGEVWVDKGRDHNYCQLNVSLQETMGGARPTTGCPTPSAQNERNEGRKNFYNRQIMDIKTPETENPIK